MKTKIERARVIKALLESMQNYGDYTEAYQATVDVALKLGIALEEIDAH